MPWYAIGKPRPCLQARFPNRVLCASVRLVREARERASLSMEENNIS
jgi:hypothetical protein